MSLLRCFLPVALLLPALLLAGCATAPPPAATAIAASGHEAGPAERWREVRLPGKKPTHYAWTAKQGRSALQATADGSASMWRHDLRLDPAELGRVEFSWWVDALVKRATVSDVERSDAPARVVFAFDGDHARLSPKNRLMFELAETLSGERPPYATLVYAWDATAPVDSVVVSGRSDRLRKIVVESGTARLGGWLSYRRDLAADFRRAFGEEPGALIGVAVMTDADNTRSRAQAWYGPIHLDGARTLLAQRP